ncbi:MAG: hypothetical protein AAF805_11090 [Planctomycetota bacterium]
MTDRERWIVYPLLFLALGAALRDKLAKQTRAKQIICEQLYLVDAEGRPVGAWQGDRLQLDVGGRGEGYLTAGVVDAETLAQRGKPVMTGAVGGGIPVQDFLRMLPQLRFSPTTPPSPPPVDPPKAGSEPDAPAGADDPPASGPRLGPPGGQPAANPPPPAS